MTIGFPRSTPVAPPPSGLAEERARAVAPEVPCAAAPAPVPRHRELTNRGTIAQRRERGSSLPPNWLPFLETSAKEQNLPLRLREKTDVLDAARAGGAQRSPAATRAAVLAGISASQDLLTSAEHRILDDLRASRPEQPQNLILFTDPNKDPDDVATFVIGAQLERDGFIRLRDAVVTLGDQKTRTSRAEMAKGVFNSLGLPLVRVSVGRNYAMNALQATEHAKFLPEGSALRAAPDELAAGGLASLIDRLSRARGPISLVVISGMSDAAALIKQEPELLRGKIESIVIMGGIEPEKDADGFVQPDERAYNNITDMLAARNFYRGAQALGIPLKIVSKEAAYKAAVPPAFYEDVARTRHPVGTYLKDVQKNALKGLWEGINAGLIPLSTDWFLRTFVSQEQADARRLEGAPDPGVFDDIWPQVTKLNLYDPLTLLAAVEGSARMLFTPTEVNAAGKSSVMIIGEHEMTQVEKAKVLLSALAKSALVSIVDPHFETVVTG